MLKDACGCGHRQALLLRFIGHCFPCFWIDPRGSDLVACSKLLSKYTLTYQNMKSIDNENESARDSFHS